jgi:hypothetical protein
MRVSIDASKHGFSRAESAWPTTGFRVCVRTPVFVRATASQAAEKSFSSGGRCFSADVNCVLSLGFSP